MTWIKLDDALWRHRKIAEIDPDKALAAVGLWVLGLSWVGEHLTDGYLTDRALVQAAGAEADAIAGELVRVGLWERVEGGYLYHDFLDYNPSQDQVMTLRAKHIEAARIAGHARAKGARRSTKGTFTSGDAGQDAGDTAGSSTSDQTSVATTPVSRLPSPKTTRRPEPVSHIASAGANALETPPDLQNEPWNQRVRSA